jgi:hypothetical protein
LWREKWKSVFSSIARALISNAVTLRSHVWAMPPDPAKEYKQNNAFSAEFKPNRFKGI